MRKKKMGKGSYWKSVWKHLSSDITYSNANTKADSPDCLMCFVIVTCDYNQRYNTGTKKPGHDGKIGRYYSKETPLPL
jgi:hypothetical protein